MPQPRAQRDVGRPSSEVIGLLRRTHALMESGELEQDEDTVSTVFDQLAGFEVACARHVFCSRAVESLLRMGTDAQRRRYFGALLGAGDVETIMIDRYASHLVDLLCALAADAANDAGAMEGQASADGCAARVPSPVDQGGEGTPPSLTDAVVLVADALAEDPRRRATVVYDRYGSHVVQTVVTTLAGERPRKGDGAGGSSMGAPSPRGGAGDAGGRGVAGAGPGGDVAAHAESRPFQAPQAFRDALLRFVAALARPGRAAPATNANVESSANSGGKHGAEGPKAAGRGAGRYKSGGPLSAAGASGTAASAGELGDMVIHSCAAVCVQAVLRALRGDTQTLVPFLECLLEWPDLSASALPGVAAARRVREWAAHAAGARVLEALLQVSPASIVSSLYTNVFRGHTPALARGRISNFVVQRILERAEGDAMCGMLLGELENEGPALLEEGCVGVVWKMVDACTRNRARERDAFRAVTRMLAPAGLSPATLATALLWLNPQAQTPTAQEGTGGLGAGSGAGAAPDGGARGRVHVVGARLAQACLQLAPQHCQPLVASFHKLPAPVLVSLACDQAGSRVVESLFTARGCPPAARAPLARKLRGAAARLARDKFGSHVLERCFTAVDVDAKKAVLDELVSAEQALMSSRHAALVMRRLRVADYRRRQSKWVDEETAAAKKRRLFAEIIDERVGGEAEAGASGSAAPPMAALEGAGTDAAHVRSPGGTAAAESEPNGTWPKARRVKKLQTWEDADAIGIEDEADVTRPKTKRAQKAGAPTGRPDKQRSDLEAERAARVVGGAHLDAIVGSLGLGDRADEQDSRDAARPLPPGAGTKRAIDTAVRDVADGQALAHEFAFLGDVLAGGAKKQGPKKRSHTADDEKVPGGATAEHSTKGHGKGSSGRACADSGKAGARKRFSMS